MAHLLCEMATRLDAVDGSNEVQFDLPVTQTQVADAISITPVHVNRTLQTLRAEGLVEWRSRMVRLPQWDALVATAEFDPTYLQRGSPQVQRLRIAEGS